MSDKPSPKPSAGKFAGSGTPAGTKGASAATPSSRSKPSGDPDETYDFLAKPQGRGELGRLAHYRVLKVLGKGGMGIVFMAEDTRLHRVVALKVMLPSIAKKAIARDRFLREARATAAIEHDHIVTIYEVSKEDIAVPYLAMQFLQGMNLEDFLKAGKTLNVPKVMRIGKEIAKALAAAHARQLIHRDIKPSNIWLDAVNKGRVKILDFGLARPTNEETHLTQEGMILGSPAYMSPEQARGENVDERCDLFSLGCVLYRLCAGRLPFAGKDAMSTLLEITSKEPPPLVPLSVYPDLPPALAELVHRLLAKNPADRPASAKEVVETIQAIERAWVAGARTMAMPPAPSAPTAPKPSTFDYKDMDVEPVLEESAITELELQAPNATPEPAPRSRWWVFAALPAAILGAITCCLVMGIAIAMTADRGYVEVSADDEARKLLADTVLTVRDHHDNTHALDLHEPVRLPTGAYEIDNTGLPKTLQIDPSRFTLRWGETLKIRVSYKSLRPALVLVTREEAKKLQRDWAIYLKRDVVENSTSGMKLTLIPPGEFLMGSTDEQLRQHLNELKNFAKKILPDNYQNRVNSEKPQHRVRISKPFYLGTTEVPLGQFTKFVASNKKYLTEPEIKGGGQGIEAGKDVVRKAEYNWKNPGFVQTGENPLCNITWKDAEAYCAWLSNQEKKVYRLPTEAEWEYACRAGSTTLWSFGDETKDLNPRDRPWCLFAVKDFKDFKAHTSHPVGKKKENDFGLFDLHGNVAEMCSDYWSPTYERVANGPVAVDPKGADATPKGQRVVRGGSFMESMQAARSAYRSGIDPTLGYVTVGFRVVCEAPLPAE